VARLRAVADAARAADREVVVIGRAMERIVQIARETGYLEGVQDFRPMDAYGYLPPGKVVALCTGSQGESRAALSRIAEDQHPEVTFSAGDRVIYSARTIPGNEKAVSRVINLLIEQGIEVITDRTHLVHVSGHPRRDEMKELYGWVRPRIAVPVHGEALHLFEHAKLAREAGVGEIVLCGDGDLVKLGPGDPGVIDEVPAARLYKDGSLLISAQARTVADRRRLSFSGVVVVSLVLGDRGELLADPQVDLMGIPETNADRQSMLEIAYDAAVEIVEHLPKGRRRDPQAVEESVKRGVRAAIAGHWGKKPICLVHVLTV
jgi:ribonuclease J